MHIQYTVNIIIVVLLVIVMVSVDQQITAKVAMQTVLSLNEAWALAIAVYTKLQ